MIALRLLWCIVLIWAFLLGAATRAEENSKTAQLLTLYKDCVLGTLKSQVKNSFALVELSAATEIAFQACRTEEQALFAHASAVGVSQAQANAVPPNQMLDWKRFAGKFSQGNAHHTVSPNLVPRSSRPSLSIRNLNREMATRHLRSRCG